MPTMTNTRTAQRRPIRFGTISQLRAELDGLEAAHRAGRLKARGNWTPGQCLGHLAIWVAYTYDGYPPPLRPPWFIRLIMKLRKKKMLAGPPPQGVRIPGIEGGTLGTEDLPFEQALADYRKEIQRLEAGPPALPSILFGPMTHEEWKQWQFRHAELHLGFLDPGN
jgi:hypothetical protein